MSTILQQRTRLTSQSVIISRCNRNSYCSGSSSSSSYMATDGQSASSSGRSPRPDFNFVFMTIAFFLLHVGRPLWWEDGSVICSAITHWLEPRRTHNHILLSHLKLPQSGGPGPRIYPHPPNKVAQLFPRALVSLSVTSYDSQGYGGGILTSLHIGLSWYYYSIWTRWSARS
jgi:hypothetical protein